MIGGHLCGADLLLPEQADHVRLGDHPYQATVLDDRGTADALSQKHPVHLFEGHSGSEVDDLAGHQVCSGDLVVHGVVIMQLSCRPGPSGTDP